MKLIQYLFPNTFVGWFGCIIGALSILALINNALDVSLASSLLITIKWYDQFLKVTLGLAKPYIENFIIYLLDGFKFEIELNDIWMHITTLTGLYFLRNVIRLYSADKYFAAIYQLFFSLFIMFTVGGVAGVIYQSNSNYWVALAVATCPIIGTFLMAIAQSVWFAFSPQDRPFRLWPDFQGTKLHFISMQALYGFI